MFALMSQKHLEISRKNIVKGEKYMPRYVVEKKNKTYLLSAIVNTILCLIPIGIIALISIGNPNIWSAPYPKFMLYFLIVHSVYAIGVGYIGQIHKIAYIIFESIAVLGTLTLIVLGFVLGNPIIMHLATASLFVMMMYLFSNFGGDNYNFRYFIPVAISISALITILWFVGVGMSLTAHIVIVSILDFIFGLISFFRIKGEIKDNFDFIEEKELSYNEETEEEKRARKEAHYNDPKVKARRERRKKALKVTGKIFGSVFGFAKRLLPHFGPPASSKDWSQNEWAKYIADRVDNAGIRNHDASYYADYSVGIEIEIYVKYDPYDDVTQKEYDEDIQKIKDRFRSACKKCPFNASLNFR